MPDLNECGKKQEKPVFEQVEVQRLKVKIIWSK